MTLDELFIEAQSTMKERNNVTAEDLRKFKEAINKIKGFLSQMHLDEIFPEVIITENPPPRIYTYNGLFIMQSHVNTSDPISEIWLSDQGVLLEAYRETKKLSERADDHAIIEILRDHGGYDGVTDAIGAALKKLRMRGKQARSVA